MSWLSEKLEKTRVILNTPIEDLFSGKKPIGDDLLDELEEALIVADLGVAATTRLMKGLRKKVEAREISTTDELKPALASEILAILEPCRVEPFKPRKKPHVVLIMGVNGVGKTTTIGKLAARYTREGMKVLVVAADTFRAAAVEQLAIWADRAGVAIVRHKDGADPAAVVFDGVEAAVARGMDVVLVDTAGRLHTKVNLMEELKKIKRIAGKNYPGSPHDAWLILDASTGQNALSQAKLFNEAIGVTGLILTKLDGTAKGGMVAAVAQELEVPIRYIGLGEKVDDLRDFDPDEFVKALF